MAQAPETVKAYRYQRNGETEIAVQKRLAEEKLEDAKGQVWKELRKMGIQQSLFGRPSKLFLTTIMEIQITGDCGHITEELVQEWCHEYVGKQTNVSVSSCGVDPANCFRIKVNN